MALGQLLYVPHLADMLNTSPAAIRQRLIEARATGDYRCVPDGYFYIGRRLAWDSETVERWLDDLRAGRLERKRHKPPRKTGPSLLLPADTLPEVWRAASSDEVAHE